jgi:hypothetical protein
MDHGELNVPLSKRGGINTLFGVRRVDVERAQKQAERTAIATRKATKAQAKELLALHCEAIVARHGEKFGAKALRETLDQWAKWEPAKLVSFVNKFLSEQA